RSVSLELELDRAVRLVSLSTGGEMRGTIRSVDERRQTVQVSITVEGQAVELSLEVTRGAAIRLEGKSVGLGTLGKGMPVLLRLDGQKRSVVGLWALTAREGTP